MRKNLIKIQPEWNVLKKGDISKIIIDFKE
jgi:hypothetical protein